MQKQISKTLALAIALSAGLFAGTTTMARAEDNRAAREVSEQSQHQQDVRFLREEEKLARDVYLTLHKRWSLPIFSNISQSEQRHMDRMGTLLNRYGLEDPVVDDTIGVFTNPKLAKLYTDLVARGSKSEVEALLVGATIEDLDIRDIREMRKNGGDADALDAFAKLECGSRNHMRAFTRQLAARQVSYKAKYLTQIEIDQIIEASHERCGRAGNRGRGQGLGGKGWGQGRRGNQGHSCNHE